VTRPALIRGLIVTAVALAVPLAAAAPAAAHPLGNFTVNAYCGITVTPGRLRVDYVLDLAEIPTFQEMERIDADGDGEATAEERAAWARWKAGLLLEGLSVELDGRPVALARETSTGELLPGQGGLDVLRLEARFGAPVPASGRIEFREANDEGRIGWREITATGADGVAVTGSSVPAVSVSRELQRYPEELLSSPPEVRRASFGFGPGEQPSAAVPTQSGANRPEAPGEALAGLVARRDLSPGVVLFALLAAFGVGVLHALAPGHGKTVTAAYLAGSSGRGRHAIGAGAAVAAMHTASVLALGLLVVAAQRAFPAEKVYPWLGVVAGGAALALGFGLLAARLAHRRGDRRHGHAHRSPLSRRGLAALALSGGLLPSPTAIVVLLAAASLGRLAFGLGLILAFAIGMAASLSAIAMLAIRARAALDRRLPRRLADALPVGSAAAILGMGVLLTARAVAQF
jgi:nickel/cobalt exporter